jgi:hypothetical protein
VPVVSPFPDSPSRHRPKWWERFRGIFGLVTVIAVTGVALALLVGALLLAFAILVATAFN